MRVCKGFGINYMIISASPPADLPRTRHKSSDAPRAKKHSSGSANNKGMLAN